MRKTRKIVIIMMLTIFTMMLFSGCGSKNKMGRYEEKDLKMPEGLGYITEFSILENGNIAMIANGEDFEKNYYYTSKDNGENWENKEMKIPEVEAGKTIYLRNAKIKSDGGLLAIYQIHPEMIMEEPVADEEIKPDDSQAGLDEGINSDEDYFMNAEYKCVNVDKDGNNTEFKVDSALLNQAGRFELDSNGDLYFDNYETNKIVQLDGKTGAIKKEYKPGEDYISSWAINGESLLVSTFEKLIEFDTKSGKNKGEIEVDDKVKANGLNIYPGKEKGMFYTVNVNGVYSIEIGKKSQEQIIDGTLSSFGDNNNYAQKLLQKSDDEFIASFSGMNGENVIKSYKFNSSIPAKPENQISIYSMHDTDVIRQAIVKYQKAHPDVYINLEIGMNYMDETATISDAIKTINTEIMAGKGPDIMLLDELPAKSYAEKGLLEDITDIVEKDSTVMPNIVKGSKAKDGKIYSAPLRFIVPTIIGENISGINSVGTLADNIDAISSKSTGSVIDVYAPNELVYLLYKNSGDTWINADKTINTDNLKSFLEDTKKIYDSIKDKHPQEKVNEHNEQLEMMKEYSGEQDLAEMFYMGGGDYSQLVMKKPTALALYNISMSHDLRALEGIKTIKGSLNYEMWKGQDTNSIVALNTIAINAKSEKKDIAKDFLKSLFTEEYQTSQYSYGFPVNKAALRASFLGEENQYESSMGFGGGIKDEEQEMIEVPLKPLSEATVDAFITQIEGFENIANPDIEVLRKTIDEFTAYISGAKSMDDTIKAIKSKLEIYIAE